MFSGRPSVRPSVRDSRGSFVSAISPVSVDGFSPNLSLVYLGTQMT